MFIFTWSIIRGRTKHRAEKDMDKQQQAETDSLSGVTVKEYPPSEIYVSSEPPPVRMSQAYQKPRSNAVQIARIAAITVVLVTFILGSFILAAAWVQSRSSCMPEQLAQAAALTQNEDAEDSPHYQHLVDPLQSEESTDQEKQTSAPDQQKQSDKDAQVPVQIKLPLQLDFDDLAGMLVEKNQRSRMNCVVEKRRAEEIVDHQPRTVKLPFGLNLTTDPRYEHLSGEKMAIFCESGNDQRHMPMDVMAANTPVIVPLPGPIHLPVQFQGPVQHSQRQQIEKMIAQQNRIPAVPAPQHIQQVPIPVAVPIHHPVPVQMQTAIHVSEAGAPDQQSMPVHHAPVEAREQQMHIPIHLQQEGRQGRAFHAQQIPIEIMEIREGRAFQPQQVPVEVTEVREVPSMHAAEEGRAYHHQRLPAHIPVPMMQQEPRPHYVQPRSVRSVDEVLHRREKRMRRCACDCAC